MSNSYTAKVNRELYAAAVHLSLIPEPTNGNQRIVGEALLESSLFHLVIAHRSYLRELAANYQLSSPHQIDNLDYLQEQLAAAGKTPAEATELSGLVERGWLRDLLAAYQSLEQNSTSPRAPSSPPGDSSRIASIEIDSHSPVELSLELIQRWIGNYREIIARHREIMIEY